MGLVVVSPMASVASLVTTPQAREQLVSLAASFAWNADPIKVDTIGGYTTFKIHFFDFLIATSPLPVGSPTLPVDEDRRYMDVLPALPGPRQNMDLQNASQRWTGLIPICFPI